MRTQLLSRSSSNKNYASEVAFPMDLPPTFFNSFGLGQLRRNLATGGNVKFKGSPQINPGFALMSDNDSVDSGVFESNDFTLIATAFKSSAFGNGNGMLISTNQANGQSGSSLFMNSDGVQGAVTTLNGGSEVIVQPPGLSYSMDAWGVFSLRLSGTAITLDVLTTGRVAKSTANLQYARRLTGATWRVGGAYGAGLPVGVASAALFTRAISDAELTAMASLMRATAALDSIPV